MQMNKKVFGNESVSEL